MQQKLAELQQETAHALLMQTEQLKRYDSICVLPLYVLVAGSLYDSLFLCVSVSPVFSLCILHADVCAVFQRAFQSLRRRLVVFRKR